MNNNINNHNNSNNNNNNNNNNNDIHNFHANDSMGMSAFEPSAGVAGRGSEKQSHPRVLGMEFGALLAPGVGANDGAQHGSVLKDASGETHSLA